MAYVYVEFGVFVMHLGHLYDIVESHDRLSSILGSALYVA